MLKYTLSNYFTVIGWFCTVGLVGCAAIDESSCRLGQRQVVNELLYFGTAKPHGLVSDEDWANFLRSEVTTRFPQGLTVWQGMGQWRGNDGELAKEKSFVLNLLHPDDVAYEKSINEIVAQYKKRFQQEAVLRVNNRVCISY